MDYISLSSALRSHKMHIFTLENVKTLFPQGKEKTIKNNFIRWLTKGYFVRLKKDLYEFIERGSGLRIPDLYIANRLYEPSYVSLETALSIYSIIPDIAAVVTSVSIRPTRTFKNKYGSFFYKTCQERAFTGYRLMLYEGFKVCIADKEKALVDFLYYRLRLNNSLDFAAERLNKKILKKMDWKKALNYARLFNHRTVKLLKECREYAKC
jgi:predicted transcriptional regulator of viral defense system